MIAMDYKIHDQFLIFFLPFIHFFFWHEGAQQFDTFGKIFTVKVQYVFYKERPGIRPGQVSKAERLTSRLQQFAAYAIQGDYNGVKEFGSDLRKLGVPVEHAPHVKLLKFPSN